MTYHSTLTKDAIQAPVALLDLLFCEMQALAQVMPNLCAPVAEPKTEAEVAASDAACEQQFDNMPV